MRSEIRAVVFDFYFTLVDPTAYELDSVMALVADHGLAHSAAEVMSVWRGFGRMPDLNSALDGELPPFGTFGERWRRYGGVVLADLGLPADGEAWAQCRLDAHRRAVPYGDVAVALEALRSAGQKVGVLSDADNDFIHPCIAENDLQFDAVLTSEDLRCYKPHRSAFLAVAERLAVPAEQIAYVGDNPLNDIVGSRNAGMTAVWINRNNRAWPADLDPPHHTVTSLRDLPAVLDELT